MVILGEQLSFIEISGTVFGIISVWLTIKKGVLNFPMGILNVAVYGWLFFQSKLYANASLQIIYILLLIYGWIQWKIKKVEIIFRAENIAVHSWIWLSLIFVV